MESMNGWWALTTGSVGFGTDRFGRGNNALSISAGYLTYNGCPQYALSASAWIYVTGIVTQSGYGSSGGIFQWQSGSIHGMSMFISTMSQVYFSAYPVSVNVPSVYNYYVWTHVGYVANGLWSGSTVSVYINGNYRYS